MTDYIDARLTNPDEEICRWITVTNQDGRIVEKMTPGRAHAFGEYLKNLAQEAWKK